MILKNARLQDGIFDIAVSGKIIDRIGHFDTKAELDAGGRRVIPGLVDVHLHGFRGVDSADCRFACIGDALVEEGTTSWLATLMTDSVAHLKQITHSDAPHGKANLLGFHLEGPYLSEKRSGAQNKDYLKNPSIEEYRSFRDVKMITVAPELPGAEAFIRSVDALVSIGHTDCDYETALRAIDCGAACLTHTFNAMPPMLHRAPGPIGAAVEKGIYAQLICDGRHIAPSVVLAAYRMFGSDRLTLISDMIRAAGMPDGVYDSGGYDVVMKNGVATLTDGETLAGGSASLLHAVQFACSIGIDFYEAVKMASETPSRLLGLKKGRIEAGYDADLVLLEKDGSVAATIIGGEVVYRAK